MLYSAWDIKPTNMQEKRPRRLIRKSTPPFPFTNRMIASTIEAERTRKKATELDGIPKFVSMVEKNPMVPHRDPAISTIK